MLPALEQVLGPDHRETLESRTNLAAAYGNAGRTAESIRLHQETLPALERLLGPDHPDTLVSRKNLAITYRAADRDEDAARLEEKAGAE